MHWDFDAWLCQHRAEVEARWLASVQNLPAYVALSPDESRFSWGSLVEGLVAGYAESPVEWAGRWAAREMRERGATPAELLSIAEGLSKTIRDLLPAEANLRQVNGRVNALSAALARYFADQIGHLTAENARLETLYEITRDLSASLDLSRMLHRTLEAVVPALAAEMGALFLVDGETGRAVPETTIDWGSEGIPLDVLPAAWKLGQADALLLLNDLQTELTEPWVEALVGPDTRSFMAAPLVANGEFVGGAGRRQLSPGGF
jgi:hypothetical protein